jgi:hypothetical protein
MTDAQLNQGYCGDCGNSKPECRCVPQKRVLSRSGRKLDKFIADMLRFHRAERFAKMVCEYHYLEQGVSMAILHNPSAACESGEYVAVDGVVPNDPDWLVKFFHGQTVKNEKVECKVERASITVTGFQHAQVQLLCDIGGQIWVVRDKFFDIWPTETLRAMLDVKPKVRLRYGIVGTPDNEGYEFKKKEIDKLVEDKRVERQTYGPMTLKLIEHLHLIPLFLLRA